MSDDPEEPESRASEAKPPKKKAEDNPWYLLATLYGVPDARDQELKTRNRHCLEPVLCQRTRRDNADAAYRKEAALSRKN